MFKINSIINFSTPSVESNVNFVVPPVGYRQQKWGYVVGTLYPTPRGGAAPACIVVVAFVHVYIILMCLFAQKLTTDQKLM